MKSSQFLLILLAVMFSETYVSGTTLHLDHNSTVADTEINWDTFIWIKDTLLDQYGDRLVPLHDEGGRPTYLCYIRYGDHHILGKFYGDGERKTCKIAWEGYEVTQYVAFYVRQNLIKTFKRNICYQMWEFDAQVLYTPPNSVEWQPTSRSLIPECRLRRFRLEAGD